ncbi:MAG: hypothetical protein ACE145_02720 [Terriglobia bacterium]
MPFFQYPSGFGFSFRGKRKGVREKLTVFHIPLLGAVVTEKRTNSPAICELSVTTFCLWPITHGEHRIQLMEAFLVFALFLVVYFLVLPRIPWIARFT